MDHWALTDDFSVQAYCQFVLQPDPGQVFMSVYDLAP